MRITSHPPTARPALLRRCACGGAAAPGGECAGCRKKRLHRAAAGPAPALAPPSVHAVLASPGRPLDAAVRTRLEARLGHDLRHVRIHADARAAHAAAEVGARAWTVGPRIAFGAGEYRPGTEAGERLLTHEVVHTLQDAAPPSSSAIPIGAVDDPAEREAERVARQSSTTIAPWPSRALRRQDIDVDIEPVTPTPGMNLPSAASVRPLLPGYSQAGDTCGAASLVTALLIWDREHARSGTPNETLVNACDLILLAFAQYGAAAVARLTARLRGRPGDPQALHDNLRNAVIATRDSARLGGAASEPEYQVLGMALYFLWVSGGGLSAGEISSIRTSLGLEASGAAASTTHSSFSDIWRSSTFRSLAPDQFVQIGWYVRTSAPAAAQATFGHHALLAGRLADGSWFWSDQGPRPAREFSAATIDDLERIVRAAAATGYWIFTGGISDFQTFVVGGWTGVRLLTGPASVAGRIAGLVPAGSFLGEVDAGTWTIGDRLTSGALLGRRYGIADAEALFTGTSGGGSALIVEMPAGVFQTYSVNTVSEANVGQTALDADDSRGGVLARRSFVHTWLILGTATARRGSRFRVY